MRLIVMLPLMAFFVFPTWNLQAADAGDVVINEVAWMGTHASASDEWIELYNNSNQTIDLTGWTLAAADDTPTIELSGVIEPHGFFLLERTDDASVRGIEADFIYSGALSNEGEALTLTDADGNVIDQVNVAGDPWPAGGNIEKRSMERIDPLRSGSDNWASHNGSTSNGRDADNQPVLGTPGLRNSVSNRSPICTNAQTDAAPGVPVEIDLIDRCSDDDEISFGIERMPDHGSLQCNGAVCTYTANDDFIGEDGITFSANDGLHQRTEFTIVITVGGGGGSEDAVFFVASTNGSDNNDGLSATRPLASIEAAIERASENATIIVLGGLYRSPFVIDKPLTLEAVAASTIEVNGQTAIRIESNDVTIIGFSIQSSKIGVYVASGVENIRIERSALVDNEVAISNQSSFPVEIANAWWGCNVGPNQAGCDKTSGTVSASDWLVAGLNTLLAEVPVQTDANLIVELVYNQRGQRVPNVLSRPISIRTQASTSSLRLSNESTFVNELWRSMATLAVLMLMTDWRKVCGINAQGVTISLCCLMVAGLVGCDSREEPSVVQSVIERQLNHGNLQFTVTSDTVQTLTVEVVVDAQTLSADVVFLDEP